MPTADPFVLSLLTGLAVGAAAAYLGSLMISKRMALTGDALGHVALPGMGLALNAGLDPSLGAFAFLALGILVIWKLKDLTTLTEETLVGIAFVSSLALGFLIVPQPELLETLIGDISKLTQASAAASVVLSLGVIALVAGIYRGMMLLNLSADLAAVEGVKEGRTNFWYLLAIAVMVSLGVKVTGSLLVGALVIVPPATARVLASNLKTYRRLSLVLGALSCAAGILANQATHFPAGPAIILVNAILFGLALCYRRIRPVRQL
jgi:ABC-type Mn2+/Zn2+ transport system permease subunit